MSTQQFKPLYEQAANKLAKALTEKTSPFQRPWSPDNGPNFIAPYNRATGETYKPMNAMILAMQNREDPRWMTKAQARLDDMAVQENATPTLINYKKKSDLQPVLDEHGERVPDENMKPQMKTVELEKPQIANAWLFNGAQIDGLPDWKAEHAERQGAQELSPAERVERIVQNSGAVVIEGGDDAYYKPVADHIQMPEKEKFSVPEKYYAELLHQLTHWTGHESRLNRPMEAVYGSKGYASEELRANIATLMLSSELGIGYNFGKHAAYADNWARMLKNDPFELVNATNDAKKIVTRVMGYEQQMEKEQELSQDQKVNQNEGQDQTDYSRLQKGDVIPYEGKEFKVLAELKNNVFQMQEGDRKFKLSSKDNLYDHLLESKLYPQWEQHMEQNMSDDLGFEEAQREEAGQSMVAEEAASYKVKR